MRGGPRGYFVQGQPQDVQHRQGRRAAQILAKGDVQRFDLAQNIGRQPLRAGAVLWGQIGHHGTAQRLRQLLPFAQNRVKQGDSGPARPDGFRPRGRVGLTFCHVAPLVAGSGSAPYNRAKPKV